MSERSFRRDRERRVAAERRRQALRKRRAGLVGGIAVGAFALAPAAAQAANFEVNTLNDGAPDPSPGACTTDPAGCTLREAINDSNVSGTDDTITFLSGLTGTITLDQGSLTPNKNSNNSTTITGPGADQIAVDGAGNYLVFDVEGTGGPGGTGFSMSGLTIQNGSGSPAGGIYAEQGTNVNLSNATVTGNQASGAQVDKYSFAAGGGITNRGQMTVANTTVSVNYSTAQGTPYPIYGGGGIDNLGNLTVTGSTVTGNASRMTGGGIFNGWTNYGTSLKVSGTTIYDNFAYLGGGISGDSFFGYNGNAPQGDIGADRVDVTNSTVSGNHAFDGGGVGIKYLGGSSRWTISHSTISQNETYVNNGGGISVGYQGGGPFGYFVSSGSLNVLDSTISGNYANAYGGGAMIATNAEKYPGTVEFNNSTIASNEAGYYGGGVAEGYTDSSNPYQAYYETSLFSTIVGDNVADLGVDSASPAAAIGNDLAGDVFSGGCFCKDDPGGAAPAAAAGAGFDLSFSLVEAQGNAQVTETPAGSNIFGLDPQLGPLGDNGGPTLTQLPSINSPVVDKGSAPGNLTTDQRGLARTVDTSPANAHDGTDIGSVELPTGPPGPPPPQAGSGVKVGTLKKKHKKRRRVLRTKHSVAKVRITFRSKNPTVTFKCSVDGGAFAPCTSPFVTKLSSAPGKGKNHNIAIQQVDSSGNPIGNVRVFKFRVVLKD
jgi:CSLREA domain-containing protein